MIEGTQIAGLYAQVYIALKRTSMVAGSAAHVPPTRPNSCESQHRLVRLSEHERKVVEDEITTNVPAFTLSVVFETEVGGAL